MRRDNSIYTSGEPFKIREIPHRKAPFKRRTKHKALRDIHIVQTMEWDAMVDKYVDEELHILYENYWKDPRAPNRRVVYHYLRDSIKKLKKKKIENEDELYHLRMTCYFLALPYYILCGIGFYISGIYLYYEIYDPEGMILYLLDIKLLLIESLIKSYF